MLMKLVIIVIVGCVVVRVISGDCPALGVCVQNLELRYNTTLEKPTLQKSLNFCLSLIKDEDVCISNTGCDLTGSEPLYVTYRRLEYTTNKYCSENVCSDLTSIESCWTQLDYSGIPKGEYSQFCWSVQKCQKRPLTDACNATNQIFESQLLADPKKIIQHICNSDCENLNETVDAVRHCLKSVPSEENSCGIYNVLVECLQSFPVCPWVNSIMEYFYGGYNELQKRCKIKPTTTVSYAGMTTSESIVTSAPPKESTGEITVNLSSTAPKFTVKITSTTPKSTAELTSTAPKLTYSSSGIKSSSVPDKTTKTGRTTSKSTESLTRLTSTTSLMEQSSVMGQRTSTTKSTTTKKTRRTSFGFVTDATRYKTVNPTAISTSIRITDRMADEEIPADEDVPANEGRSTTLYVPSISKGMTTTSMRMRTSHAVSTSESANNHVSSTSVSATTSTITTNTMIVQKSTRKTVTVKTGGQTFNGNGAASLMNHKLLVSLLYISLWIIR